MFWPHLGAIINDCTIQKELHTLTEFVLKNVNRLYLELNTAFISLDGALALELPLHFFEVASLQAELSNGIIGAKSTIQIADNIVDTSLIHVARDPLGFNFKAVRDLTRLVDVRQVDGHVSLLGRRQLNFDAESVVTVQNLGTQLAFNGSGVQAVLNVQGRPILIRALNLFLNSLLLFN